MSNLKPNPTLSNFAQTQALADVLAERDRQDIKWGEQEHSDERWMMIHTEEFGEVAEAILETEFGGPNAGRTREELTQLAATCLGHLECIIRRENGTSLSEKDKKRLYEALAEDSRAMSKTIEGATQPNVINQKDLDTVLTNAKRGPTPMPAWLERQMDNVERTVATWSDGKREAAGIPRTKEEFAEAIKQVYGNTPPSPDLAHLETETRSTANLEGIARLRQWMVGFDPAQGPDKSVIVVCKVFLAKEN